MAGTRAYLLPPIVLLFFVVLIGAQDETQFIHNGFQGAHLHLDGLADIYPTGLLQMTNTSKQQSGHAFHPQPLKFGATSSFATAFVFAMNPDVPNHGGHGIAFVISPSTNFEQAVPAEYLGLFNISNNDVESNHIFAVELDTVQNAVFGDIDGNHLGIDVNGLTSVGSASAAYYPDEKGPKTGLDLTSKKPMQVWVDYNGEEKIVNVTIAPLREPKPIKPLLSTHVNLSAVLLDSMYIGFSSSTGLTANEHYILGWSWSQKGPAPGLDPSKLPPLPRFHTPKAKRRLNPSLIAAIVISVVALIMISGTALVMRRRMYEEVREPWEEEYASYRLSYRDLYVASKGFKDSELLGSGGFGKVYKGVLPTVHTQVAVKRVSHDSRQGMKEFVAEIGSMGRLRHRNLVQLLGYCRRKGELLLVYDYMPNGSLDRFLFKSSESILSWSQRFNIIKGVASALLYLHEEWEQVVLHRDVKASNVLLDAEMNARLGDFGLARLYDRDSNPQSTHVVGTLGYIAPELGRTGRPTTATDVFAFGIFLLEVACGRRPIGGGPHDDPGSEELSFGDWVFHCWKKGAILESSDPSLEGNYTIKEMELVLKLGLLCTHPLPESRPRMRHVVQFLSGSAMLPDIPSDYDHDQWGGFLGEGWQTSSSFPSWSSGVSFGTFPSHS